MYGLGEMFSAAVKGFMFLLCLVPFTLLGMWVSLSWIITFFQAHWKP